MSRAERDRLHVEVVSLRTEPLGQQEHAGWVGALAGELGTLHAEHDRLDSSSASPLG